MPGPNNEATPRPASRVVLVACLIAAAAGVIGLIGWASGERALRTFVPGLPPIPWLISAALVGSAASLWLLGPPTRRRTDRTTGRVLATIVGALGLVVVGDYAFRADPEFGAWLFGDSPPRAPRLLVADGAAPLPGILMLLTGLALLFLDTGGRRSRIVAQTLAGAIGLIALTVVVGFLFEVRRLFAVLESVPVSLGGSLGFLALAVGIFAARPRYGLVAIATDAGVGGELVRRLLPVTLLIPLVLGALRLIGEAAGLYGPAFGTAILVVALMVVQATVIVWTARALARIEIRRRRAEAERRRLLASEQRLRREAELRASQEAALRQAAEALTATPTVDAVFDEMARSGLSATRADLVYVERLDREAGEIEVAARAGTGTAGAGMPEPGLRAPYRGSFAERVIERGEPELVPRLATGPPIVLGALSRRCPECSAVLVPLGAGADAVGVLVLVRGPGNAFLPEEVARARAFGNLASLALRRIQLLEDSERRRRQLERAVESRARLVRGFSHDLKNPLGAAYGYAELLEGGVVGELAEPQMESVRSIRRSLRAALDLIDDLVEMARVEAGQIRLRATPTDVAQVARELAADYRAQAERAGLSLELRIADDVPRIRTDAGRVRQILGNLLTNAVKYTPAGGRVRIEVERCDVPPRAAGVGRQPDGRPDRRPSGRGEAVCIAVEDTGPGIPPERQEEIFEEFTRLAPSARGGAGLGLATSRRLARLLGGDVVLRSRPGVGSTFTLALPVAGAPERRRAADGGASASSFDAERERLLAQLATERARLDAVIRSVPAGILLLDVPPDRIVLANSEAERILGYASDDLGLPLEERRRRGARKRRPPPSAGDDVLNVLARALRGDTVQGEETRWRRTDGSRVWLRVGGAPVRGPEGRVIGAAVAAVDIDAEKRAESEQRLLADASRVLATSLDIKRSLGELAHIITAGFADRCSIVVLSPDGRRIERIAEANVNPERRRLFRELDRFSRDPDSSPLAPGLRAGKSLLVPEVTDQWRRSIAISDEHLDLLRRIGSESVMVVPFAARGDTFGAITFESFSAAHRFDRSDLALAEELARRTGLAIDNARLYTAALSASQVKSDFLAVMSHELRTPLNAIAGFADLLLLGVPEPLPAEHRRSVERIVASARHLRELIDEILSFSRMIAEEDSVTTETVDLGTLVRAVADGARDAARDKDLALRVKTPQEPTPIETDPAKLGQIVRHLVSNAIKFTERGRVEVEARREGVEAVIRVRDTGIGIPADQTEQIFEPFWQAEQSSTRGTGGTGLGLSITRRLARMLGGSVSVKSRVGVGSTFTVRVPARLRGRAAA